MLWCVCVIHRRWDKHLPRARSPAKLLRWRVWPWSWAPREFGSLVDVGSLCRITSLRVARIPFRVRDSNQCIERVSLLARKQGGAPFDCFDFTKRETPHLGRRACTSPEAAPVCWLSSPLFCVFIFGAPTEEGFEDFHLHVDWFNWDWMVNFAQLVLNFLCKLYV